MCCAAKLGSRKQEDNVFTIASLESMYATACKDLFHLEFSSASFGEGLVQLATQGLVQLVKGNSRSGDEKGRLLSLQVLEYMHIPFSPPECSLQVDFGRFFPSMLTFLLVLESRSFGR